MTAPDPAPRALRLALALDHGLALPEGPVGLFHPGLTDALPLPADRLRAITPLAPVRDRLAAQGVAAGPDDPPAGSLAAAIVCLPRQRDEGRDLIARAAAATTGPVVVDGQKTDGIDPVLRALRERVALSEPLAKGHGNIAWFASAPLDDWRAGPLTVAGPDGARYVTRVGLFSSDGIDPGSALLAGALPSGATGLAVDLGAGWGYLAAQWLARAPGLTALHLIEADARALDCARLNVTDPRAHFHWADATRPPADLRADHVITNPPFHQGRAADPGLGAAFIAAAAGLLRPSGTLWLVANRHLPYEAPLRAAFREVDEIDGSAGVASPGFKLFRATRPATATAVRTTARTRTRR